MSLNSHSARITKQLHKGTNPILRKEKTLRFRFHHTLKLHTAQTAAMDSKLAKTTHEAENNDHAARTNSGKLEGGEQRASANFDGVQDPYK